LHADCKHFADAQQGLEERLQLCLIDAAEQHFECSGHLDSEVTETTEQLTMAENIG
jgi:hypothetical protein